MSLLLDSLLQIKRSESCYVQLSNGDWPISPYELYLVLNTLVEVEANGFYAQWKHFRLFQAHLKAKHQYCWMK